MKNVRVRWLFIHKTKEHDWKVIPLNGGWFYFIYRIFHHPYEITNGALNLV